ncbi:hypothetical protein [Sphingomonas lacusdianchii]|uniref:hypothetical protein n=1 Tax=Sphingomonas lacusdianchii TaxID=2917992 RepID=UPI001F59D04F|nr:hypothetical protein [Sphingomonas sp. JXJ CY 53]
MIVAVPGLPPVDLGITETTPTVGIADYSRRVTDDFGVTSVTKRGFSRKLSLRFAVPFGDVDALHARLADLRATQATWIADDRFRALSVVGRYKDFSIDIASQPCSFCTLTVDGFAETLDYPDNGSDPAVDGASTFRLLQPVTITDAVLRASSVPEDDAPAWSAGGTYAKGARVVVGHRVYESLIDGNTGNDPVSSTQWLDTGATNRFAMFDQALGSATTAAGSIVVTLSSSNATALAVLDVIGATVRVQGTGYDQQRAADGTIIFDGLPGGDIAVTVTGSGTVEVGTLLFGRIVALGVTENSPTAEITDYSRTDTDDFGDVTIVPRAWAKRMAARTMLRTDALDLVFERIATVRALPSLWIADEGTDALSIYGFFKDFSIEVGETTSKLSLQIEGLSEAAKVKPFGDGLPGRDGVDGKDGRDGRDGRDGLNGTDGAPGEAGLDGKTSYVHFAYADSPDGQVNFAVGLPGGRGWQGTYTDFTAADSPDPAAYVWSAYKGPAAFGLTGSGDTNVSGNALIKNRNGGWDTGGGYSTEGWRGGAQCSFSAGQTTVANIMAGLNSDPAANDSFNTIDYAWWLAEDGICRIYESGAGIALIGEYATSDVFQIIYDGAFVRYIKGGVTVRTIAAPADALFYFDAALAGNPGTRLDAITFAAAGKAGADGKDGVDGVPGVKGADGTTYYPYFAYANSPDGSVDFTTGAPDGRAYVGFATGTSATEPDSWVYYAWTPYRGPAFGMTSRGQCVVAGDQVIKSGGAEAWDSDAYSTVGYRGAATASFRPGSADILVMVGLNADPAADASYTSLDYAWYLARNGAVGIFESGALVAEPFVGYDDSFVFQVAYDGTAVRYLCNGAVYREVPTTANRLFYFDSSIAGPGSRVVGVDFRSAGTAGANGADGRNGTDGAPGVNGADGRTSYTHYAYADTPNGQVNFTVDQPGGRAYIGTYTDFVAADSPDPNAYTWTPYKGPPAFGLTGSGDTFVAGNALVKQGSGGWGTGGGYSTEGYRRGAQCGFVPGQASGVDIMAGLNTDPATNDSYDTIDYCWYLHSNGHAYIFESGNHVAADIVGFGFGTFQVVYNNKTISYIYNGFTYREVAVPADLTFYFDAALAGGPGTRLNSITFGSAGTAGKDGLDGIPGTNGTNGQNGRDGTNGADGRTSYVHYAYADSSDGHANFTTGAAEGRSFVGIYVDYSEPDSGNPDSYRWTRLRGLDGNNGLPGAPGADGRTPYVHTAYANAPDGSVDFTTDDAQALNRRYIGLRTDYQVADIQDPAAYVWSLSRGADGANGVSPFALDLGSAAIVLNATYAGVTKPGQLPRNVAVSVKQGTTDAIGAVAIGISTSTGIAASYANGVVSITTADADGYVEVSASQGGVNVVAPKRISISRSLDAPPPQTATGVTQRGYNGDPNNTSYLSGPSGKIVTVGVPANGVLPIEIYLEYSVLENQSFAFRTYAAAAKIVHRPVGSGAAWSDLISEVSGTIAQWSRSTQEYEQGELNYPSSVNLPGGQAFEFALMLRKHSGNGSAQYVDGFMRIGE